MADAIGQAMPLLLEAVTQRCEARLPATAFLRTDGGALLRSLQAYAAERREPGYRALVASTVIRGRQAVSGEEALALFRNEMFPMVLSRLSTEDCGDLDTFFASSATVSPEALGRMATSIMALLPRPPGRPHYICPL